MKQPLLAKKLKDLRNAHDYTQDYVASVLGIVRQTYSHYETGKRSPGPDILYKLAGLYDISLDDLMHSTIAIDRNKNYDAPTPSQSAIELVNMLNYLNSPDNANRLRMLTPNERELIYFFEQISEDEQKEMIEFTKIKARKKK